MIKPISPTWLIQDKKQEEQTQEQKRQRQTNPISFEKIMNDIKIGMPIQEDFSSILDKTTLDDFNNKNLFGEKQDS